ncbi:MAG: ATP-binding protein [Candidatus Kerfeldbacteria bacterium]|nr:ATP-binding protein [Candidatus Kerfeldbacteria bacterium]
MFKRNIFPYLLNWKDKPNHKPLILRGARQVGKTSAVVQFAKEQFADLVYINLEQADHFRWFNQPMTVTEFEQIVDIQMNKKLISGKTLLFIDEIQESADLLQLLRFFYEQRPELHVIAAGSLLEAKMMREGLSLPVGRVEYLYMYPLDFFEYLQAKGETQLLDFLRSVDMGSTISAPLHHIALQQFYEYTMIGGMPEVVRAYMQSRSVSDVQTIYSSLLTTYAEDVYKYAGQAQARYLQYVIDQSPLFAGATTTYEKFGQQLYHSRDLRFAFETLNRAMILSQISATQSIQLPLIAQQKRVKKLLFLDVGLVNYRSGIQAQYVHLKDLHEFYRGRIAEQVVGQQLIAQGMHEPLALYYWGKSKMESSAELDFCFAYQGSIVGLEVKSGSAMKLRSLHRFAEETAEHQLVRVSREPLQMQDMRIAGKVYQLLSVPFYLTPRLVSFFV